jgi:hypothetical protein
MIREWEVMPARSALKTIAKDKTRLFHARMLVTRVEEWCVEAATAEEARALFAAGGGHRCTPGDSIHAELEHLIDD